MICGSWQSSAVILRLSVSRPDEAPLFLRPESTPPSRISLRTSIHPCCFFMCPFSLALTANCFLHFSQLSSLPDLSPHNTCVSVQLSSDFQVFSALLTIKLCSMVLWRLTEVCGFSNISFPTKYELTKYLKRKSSVREGRLDI